MFGCYEKHVPYFKKVINVLHPTMLEHQWNIFAIVRFMWRHNPWICLLHGCCAFHSLMNHSWRMNFKHHPINITVPNIQLIWGMQQQQTCYQSQWYNHIYSIATTATLLQQMPSSSSTPTPWKASIVFIYSSWDLSKYFHAEAVHANTFNQYYHKIMTHSSQLTNQIHSNVLHEDAVSKWWSMN